MRRLKQKEAINDNSSTSPSIIESSRFITIFSESIRAYSVGKGSHEIARGSPCWSCQSAQPSQSCRHRSSVLRSGHLRCEYCTTLRKCCKFCTVRVGDDCFALFQFTLVKILNLSEHDCPYEEHEQRVTVRKLEQNVPIHKTHVLLQVGGEQSYSCARSIK